MPQAPVIGQSVAAMMRRSPSLAESHLSLPIPGANPQAAGEGGPVAADAPELADAWTAENEAEGAVPTIASYRCRRQSGGL